LLESLPGCPMRLQQLYNPLVLRLLRSPLHPAMSKATMLLTYTGRKSRRTYTTPVNYVRDGDELLVVGSREHSWWKNLRGGGETARVGGRDMKGEAEAFEGEAAEEGLVAVLRAVPAYRRYWKVELGGDGHPRNPDALRRVAEGNALVKIRKLVPA
jgi:deazaflavin-dependent oxidoreductase (nitroreductase family)